MAFVLEASTQDDGGQNDVTSTAIDTTGADFIIVGVNGSLDGTTDITDSESNTWVYLGQVSSALKCWLVFDPTTSASHTFTYSENGSGPQIVVGAYSGSDGGPYDVQSSNGVFSSTISPGSLTPAEDNSLLVTIAGNFNGTFSSIDSSFTIQEAATSGNTRCALADLEQGTAAAVNPT